MKNLKLSKGLSRNEMISIKGGTSTTLMVVVGIAENEYEDTNGNGTFDEGDTFKKLVQY
jgi:NaMN:DMB phosphoribosyltransferase